MKISISILIRAIWKIPISILIWLFMKISIISISISIVYTYLAGCRLGYVKHVLYSSAVQFAEAAVSIMAHRRRLNPAIPDFQKSFPAAGWDSLTVDTLTGHIICVILPSYFRPWENISFPTKCYTFNLIHRSLLLGKPSFKKK